MPEEEFILALCNDLIQSLPSIYARPFNSIFIGGGTPSLISGAGITRLLTQIQSQYSLNPNAEITIEANPGTVDIAKLTAYRQAGINRLSLGVQSFTAQQLKTIGRIHAPNAIYQAVAMAKSAGFTNINLDLMFGLPNQTVKTAVYDLMQAIELEPQHLSWYQLILEPNTTFAQCPPSLPNENVLSAIQAQGQKLLATNGFVQYEVSAYARTERQCQHNLNYWQFGDYLGIGPGAHSKLTQSNGQVYRVIKPEHPNFYMTMFNADIATTIDTHNLTTEDLIAEFMLNALRLRDGFALTLFEERTNLNRSYIATTLAQAQSKGLVAIVNDWVQTTPLGYRFLNQLLLEFLNSS